MLNTCSFTDFRRLSKMLEFSAPQPDIVAFPPTENIDLKIWFLILGKCDLGKQTIVLATSLGKICCWARFMAQNRFTGNKFLRTNNVFIQ